MGVDRLERVNSLLKRVIAEGVFTIMQGQKVPSSVYTITSVACGRDLRDAIVNVSVFGDEALKKTALGVLRNNARRFQDLINRQVRLKFTPRLDFRLDRSLEKGDEVLAILSRLEEEATRTNG